MAIEPVAGRFDNHRKSPDQWGDRYHMAGFASYEAPRGLRASQEGARIDQGKFGEDFGNFLAYLYISEVTFHEI